MANGDGGRSRRGAERNRVARPHIPLAIVYNFDGTLAQGNAQEPQFLPDVGVKPADFWAEVDALAAEHQADKILMYMRLMLEKALAANVPVRLQDFRERGSEIRLFKGVEEWFDRIAEYGRRYSVSVTHFLVSSGKAHIWHVAARHAPGKLITGD